MKMVINKCYGGFSLSEEACKYLGTNDPYDYTDAEKRSDPKLIECVEKLGEKANGKYALLKIVEVPDDVPLELYNYAGEETVHEKHKSWY